MVLEAKSQVIRPDSITEKNNSSDKQPIDEKQLLSLCWELYSARDSIVRKTALDNQYDFELWLKSKNQISHRSNLAILMSELPINLSQEQLKIRVNRWLNQNLPK